jgi:alpha-tubulin suppressor-like RCC1 family protein
LAVKTDGTLWAWGHNYYGQLGDGGDADVDVLSPKRIGNGVASVAAGTSHSVLLGTGAGLFAWGDGPQVGDGSNKLARTPVRIGSGYASAAAGDEHSLAITTDGRVFAWGSDFYGQLGDGDTGLAPSYSPTAVPGLND